MALAFSPSRGLPRRHSLPSNNNNLWMTLQVINGATPGVGGSHPRRAVHKVSGERLLARSPDSNRRPTPGACRKPRRPRISARSPPVAALAYASAGAALAGRHGSKHWGWRIGGEDGIRTHDTALDRITV